MLAEERRQQILQHVARHGTASIGDLAERFDVSEMTIHRDLHELAERDLVDKVRGGAVAKHVQEIPFRVRVVQHRAEKRALAERAARLVRPGMTLFLAPGTTVAEFGRALPTDLAGLEILTNSLPIASELTLRSEHAIHLTGGAVRRYAEALVGESVRGALEERFVNLAVIAVTGIDLEGGLTVYSREEAEVLRTVIRSARETVLLTDASKYGRVMGPAVLPLLAVHRLVSTAPVPPSYADYCRRHDVELIEVDVPDADPQEAVHG